MNEATVASVCNDLYAILNAIQSTWQSAQVDTTIIKALSLLLAIATTFK